MMPYNQVPEENPGVAPYYKAPEELQGRYVD